MLNTTKTKTCNRCGKDGLRWVKSARTGCWYLEEDYMRQGHYRYFRAQRPHKCAHKPAPTTLYGTVHTVEENPETHQHRWLNWQPRVGSQVYGVYCLGCRVRLVD